MKSVIKLAAALLAGMSMQALAYDNASIFSPGQLGVETLHEGKPASTLITNVHVFDGKNENRLMNANVLIEGKLIKAVSSKPIEAEGATVIEPGAYADLLLVDGNPLEDITVIGGTDKWFDADPEWKPIETIDLIMMSGAIYKNTL